MDDCLKSVEMQEMAIVLDDLLRKLLLLEGFNLMKWICNSRAVLETILPSDCVKEVKDLDLSSGILLVERVLRVCDGTSRRTNLFLRFKLKEKPPTHRGLLSIASSIYHPLGFISPFVLSAKIILQVLCWRRLNWDDTIPSECLPQTQWWLEMLPVMEQFSIKCCYKPQEFRKIANVQMHHFSNVCELRYGTVSYLRFTNTNGNVHCSFLMSKKRVAPLKSLSVPHLELTAATLAVKLDKMFRTELEIPIHCSMFWTDSMSVLRYIENEDKRFHTLVSNRLTIIHDGTTPGQWR